MPQTFTVGSRSFLVTVTAWLVIALAVVTALTPALGTTWLPAVEPVIGRLGLVSRLAGHLPWLLAGAALTAAALLACATGLLLRLEWARRLAIAVLALSVCGQVAGLWLQHEVVAGLLDATLHHVAVPEAAAAVLGGLAWAAQTMGWLLTLAACALMVWLMARLMSGRVRQEFA